MFISNNWKDYELIDAGDGEKLERWGNVILCRPDPQAIWPKGDRSLWAKADAIYHRSASGGGEWEYRRDLPEKWTISYRDLTFKVSPTGFKHTGLFPEQAVNWDFMTEKIKNAGRPVKVLNLFAYTGGATIACAKAGAEVTHVDASKGMTEWAKENRDLSGLQDARINFIVDDCLKFVEREKRRGHTYQGIVMDPPSYGRGPKGEMWKFEKEIIKLVYACAEVFADDGIFFIINSYTTGVSNVVLEDVLKTMVAPAHPNGKIETGEVVIPVSSRELLLPCGIVGRFEA